MAAMTDTMENVAASITWEKRRPLEEALPVLSRLGVKKMHLSACEANPVLGARRLAEIGARIRDAGLEVATYSPGHELGENSPDALPLKIEAAKALGAGAVCLSLPDDGRIARSSGIDGAGRQYREDFHLAEFLASDWKKALRQLREADLGMRLVWRTGLPGRSTTETMRSLLSGCRGRDIGVFWYAYGDPLDFRESVTPHLRAFGRRILDFQFDFNDRGKWFDHYDSYYAKYPQYSVEQKMDKCIQAFRECWPQMLAKLPERALGTVEFRLGERDGESEEFLARQLRELSCALSRTGTARKAGKEAGK